jgi:hypothetical protein
LFTALAQSVSDAATGQPGEKCFSIHYGLKTRLASKEFVHAQRIDANQGTSLGLSVFYTGAAGITFGGEGD